MLENLLRYISQLGLFSGSQALLAIAEESKEGVVIVVYRGKDMLQQKTTAEG